MKYDWALSCVTLIIIVAITTSEVNYELEIPNVDELKVITISKASQLPHFRNISSNSVNPSEIATTVSAYNLSTFQNISIVAGLLLQKNHYTGYLRKLAGSNCVLIERGTVSPYYQCIGCDIKMAISCITDFRANRSGNVASSCTMGVVNEVYGASSCCPQFHVDSKGKSNLMYIGSGYPQTLRCINAVGCSSSSIYRQLFQECDAVCPLANNFTDQFGGPICHANYNAAISLRASISFFSLAILFATLFFTNILWL